MQQPIRRRVFLQAGAATAGSLAAARILPGAEPAGTSPHVADAPSRHGEAAGPSNPTGAAAQLGANTLREPAREVPIVDSAEVVVCGGGPAGVAAAIAAARQGARTRLIEAGGCLGGTWTAGLLSWILDSGNKQGIVREILDALKQRGAARWFGADVGYDVEEMKRLLEQLALSAGVRIRLHTRVVAAAREPAGHIRCVLTESKSGREAFAGRVFVDATGDGDLAAQAGCGFDVGRAESGACQPMSMIVLLAGLDPAQVAPMVRHLAEPAGQGNPKDNLLAELRRAGVEPSYSRPTLLFIRDGLFCLSANHQYGIQAFDADGITAATMAARAELHTMIDALRRLGGRWENLRLVATPEHIGVREGRRVHGLYTVTRDDLIRGARHDDAVCRVTFPVDVHATDTAAGKGYSGEGVRVQPYDIPYRALVAKDLDNLLLAGRLISGDFIAHASYRVTGNAAALGEVAGAAGALAAKSERPPREVPWSEIASAIGR